MNLPIFRRRANISPAGLLFTAIGLGAVLPATAAELTIADDVVVKFGEDAGLVVRDGLQSGRNTVLTSLADDSRGGQTQAQPSTPTAGDWRGVRIEPTVAAAAPQIRGLTVRYGGADAAAALELAGGAHTLQFLDVADSVLGIRASEAGAFQFDGLSLNRNQTGLEVRDNALVSVNGSDISGNTALGVLNLTPTTVVDATGNWWGAPSGPAAPDNPDGEGDAVSDGVDVGGFADGIPLIDCSIRTADGLYTVALAQVDVALACRNAVEFRLAPSASFDGIPFVPMAATSQFTLQPPVGQKQIHAQYRAATGNTRAVMLPQPIQYNPGVPAVAILSPLANAEVTTDTLIVASASHNTGIAKVDFYIGNQLIGTRTQPPYEMLWKIDGFAVADYQLRVRAFSASNQSTQVQQTVKLRPGNVDPAAPIISDIRFDEAPLNDGDTLTRPGLLSFAADAPSGIQNAGLRVDNTPIAGGQFKQGRYSLWLDFATIADGPHVFTLEATNGFDVMTQLPLNLDVDLDPPPAPHIAAPTDGSVVAKPHVAVSGTAQPGSQVRLVLDDTPLGAWLATGPSGSFASSVTLTGEGTHRIAAEARNARGTGPRSADVFVTLTPSDPVVTLLQPANGAILVDDTAVAVAIVDATGIDRVEYLVDGETAHVAESAPFGWTWPLAGYDDGPHTLTALAVNTAGRNGETSVTVQLQKAPPPAPPVPTPYTGVLTEITPSVSYGTQPVRIQGQAVERDGGEPVPHALLQLALDVNGYTRRINVASGDDGAFDVHFQPTPSDAGLHRVAALHPDETAQDWSGSFTIDRLKLHPTTYHLQAARTVPQTIRITVSASAGTGATGVRLEATLAEQPSGSLPVGVQIGVPSPVTIAPGGSRALDVTFLANDNTPQTGTVVLALYANGSGSAVRGRVQIPFVLSAPQPMLVPQPMTLQAGLTQGQQRVETVQLTNKGLIAATGVGVQLLDASGTGPAPAWMQLASPAQIGNIAVGESAPLQLSVQPGTDVSDGVHQARLRVSAANAVGGDIPVAISVTHSGVGSVRFHAADIYTATLDGNGDPILGLANARIRVRHETVPGVGGDVITDAEGVATLPDLPAGHYTWRATAADHSDASGRVLVQPGMTAMQDVFLAFDAISIEWEVTETTIEDEYEVVIGATYQTEVPAPVVLIEPAFINLPAMQQGEEWSGQITISNYGLVQAENLVFVPAADDANFDYTFIGEVPSVLPARERITLGFKVVAQQTLAKGTQLSPAGLLAPSGVMSALPASPKAGSCQNYRSGMAVTFDYQCANGSTQSGGSTATFGRTWGQCSSGGSGGGGGGGGGGIWGGGYGGPAGAPIGNSPGCTPNCKKCCTKGGGPGG